MFLFLIKFTKPLENPEITCYNESIMKLNFNNITLTCTGSASQFPKDNLPKICFSGRSNVGKSSLINTLTGRKSLARVGKMPGKTVTVNFYNVDGKCYFVDLPGYGFANRAGIEKEKFSTLVESYFSSCPPNLAIQLVDCKVGPTGDDCMMLDWLSHANIPTIIAVTKIDKLNKTTQKKQLEAIATHPLITGETVAFSSHTGEGKAELLQKIYDILEKGI